MKNMLAVFCVLFCVLHGANSMEKEDEVKDLFTIKQSSLGFGRKLGTVALNDIVASVAGSKAANKGTCTMWDRMEPGFARKGVAFRQTIASNATNCAVMCDFTVEGCIAINYRTSDRACFFLVDPGYIYASPGYTTALVKSSESNVCDTANMLLGYDRWGGDMSKYEMPGNPHKVSSSKECCKLCYNTPGCVTYVVVQSRYGCWLRKGVPPIARNYLVVTGIVCLNQGVENVSLGPQ